MDSKASPKGPRARDPSQQVDHSSAKPGSEDSLFSTQRAKAAATKSAAHGPHDVLKSISSTLRSDTRNAGPRISTHHADEKHVPWEDPLDGLTAREASDSSLRWVRVLRNLSPAALYESALANEKGSHIVSSGALATLSGAKTGRIPRDKRVAFPPEDRDNVWWGDGSPNIMIDDESFTLNRERALDYLNSLDRIYVVDGYANWHCEHRLKIRVICSRAYHALFMRNMLIRPSAEELADFGDPHFVIYNAGAFPANRYTRHMTSSTSVDVHFGRMEMVILGTQYAGEMKKGLFTLMHYLMPKRGLLSLHSGCNCSRDGKEATLFFGLSGTGKTTLSTDPNRPLVGDDEHVWADDGIFNIEGGCYAKAVNLDPVTEPEIHNAIRFGSVLENVVFDDDSREVDYRNVTITENTRACYPIEHIPGAWCSGPRARGGHGVAPHAKNVILLCCDAFGVLPPISRLTHEQAMYYFINGYTAKVAGTEIGVKEPEATFSACFGSAFLVWHPLRYAAMLGRRLSEHGAQAWLVNTGWVGGAYGDAGAGRMPLPQTRRIIDAIHSGKLSSDERDYGMTPDFRLRFPRAVDGVPSELLDPAAAWRQNGREAAHAQARERLARMFVDNYEHIALQQRVPFGVSREEARAVAKAGPAPYDTAADSLSDLRPPSASGERRRGSDPSSSLFFDNGSGGAKVPLNDEATTKAPSAAA